MLPDCESERVCVCLFVCVFICVCVSVVSVVCPHKQPKYAARPLCGTEQTGTTIMIGIGSAHLPLPLPLLLPLPLQILLLLSCSF